MKCRYIAKCFPDKGMKAEVVVLTDPIYPFHQAR